MKFTNITIHSHNLDIYLEEIRKGASEFNEEEEKRLFDQVAKGSKKAEREIFARVAKFGVALAKTYTNNPDLLQDLIQEANIGILEAIPKFEQNRGYHFISFAVYYMKLHISNFLADMNLISGKNPKIDRLCKRITKKYNQDFDRNPSESELVEELEKQGVVVKNKKTLHSISVSSLDQKVGTGDDSETFAETGEVAELTASHNGIVDTAEKEDIHFQVSVKMSLLSDREKEIITLKFGLEDGFPMDYKDIAKKVNLTPERVRQIALKSLEKMK